MHRLAMDERMLLDAQTGVATYARGLRAAQRQIAEQSDLLCDRIDPKAPPSAPMGRPGRWLRALSPLSHTTCALGDRYIAPDVFRLAQVHFDIWDRLLRVRLPGPAGIAHWSYPLPLELLGWRNVYTIHDVIPLVAPTLTPIDPHRHRRLLDAIARRATAFVTVSEAARSEIEGVLDRHPPIVNCGQAVAAAPIDGPLPSGLEPRRYWLVVGAIEKRKNIPAIVEAHRRSGSDWPLVIVGPDGWGSDAINPSLTARNLLRIPYLPIDRLHAMMAQAGALLMVSLAEGFGLPIAEAMVLGTPVITANRGAQAEVAGDAALLVDPDQPAEIAAAMHRLGTDTSLWRDLAGRGAVRTGDFSPPRFADRLRAFYATIA